MVKLIQNMAAAAARHYLVRQRVQLMGDEANKRHNFPRKKLSQTFDKYLHLIVYRVGTPHQKSQLLGTRSVIEQLEDGGVRLSGVFEAN